MYLTADCEVHCDVNVISNFTSFVEENNQKLMPSIAFSSLEVPHKCVDGPRGEKSKGEGRREREGILPNMKS